ncbi:hypothetical protein AAVH_26839 [Aphelenchoides avenae]|nr:hypothetical protein AAVH_26839 [Aphelenchus avenae]
MPECRTELDEMLKPGTVRHLLKKREILRSITEDVTQGNVEYSQRFMDYEKVSQADVQRHVKDIPKLEKEVQELDETVNTMKEQRRAGNHDSQPSS